MEVVIGLLIVAGVGYFIYTKKKEKKSKKPVKPDGGSTRPGVPDDRIEQ